MRLSAMRSVLLLVPLLAMQHQTAFSQSGPIVEFRRTFRSDKCDSGEVYINNHRTFLFLALPSVWGSLPKENELSISRIENEELAIDYYPNKVQSIYVRKEGGEKILSAALLNNDSFSFYEKRNLKHVPPEKTIYLGFKVFNRFCMISSNIDQNRYNDDDYYLSISSDIIGRKIFNVEDLERNFHIKHSTGAIVITRDISNGLTISVGEKKLLEIIPPKNADSVGKGDNCLSKLEHMGNTIHYQNSSERYERRDNVVLCTTLEISNEGKFSSAIESVRDVRFIKIYKNEVCATVLGLPLNTGWYIHQNDYGAGIGFATECLNGSYSTNQEIPLVQYR